jgi:predicted Fe-Mo cluster-binding NifX family protein
MRIAIPCDEPNIDAPISHNFGRALYFCIYDNGERRIVENPGGKAMRRAGVLAANALVSMKVDAVVARTVGPNSRRILEATGVKIILTDARTPREAIEALGSF